MESRTEQRIQKQILKDIKYHEKREYKDGAERTWEYQFSRAIQPYKTYELLVDPNNKLVNDIADQITNNIKQNWSNETNLTEQQLKFYHDCSRLILGGLTIHRPILVPVKCGFGKSTFIKAYIGSIIKAVKDGILSEANMQMIIAADRIDDLKNIQSEIRKEFGNYCEHYLFGEKGIDKPDSYADYIYVLESWNKSIKCSHDIRSYKESLEKCNLNNCSDFNSCKLGIQMDEQIYSPILAITNARLANLLNNEDADKGINNLRKFFSASSGEQIRNILLIDEKPYIVKPTKISIGTINNLMSKVIERYANDTAEKAEKQLMRMELNKIFDVFTDIQSEFINQQYSFVIPNHIGLTETFMTMWKKHFRSTYIGDIHAINDILINGGLYVNIRENEYFYTTTKNRFNTADMKVFVFDGTAELSLEYDGDNVFSYLDIDDYKNFENLTFNIIDENYSKSFIMEKPSKLEPVTKWINNTFKTKLFVVSHQKCKKNRDETIQVNNMLSELLKDNEYVIRINNKGKSIIPYFGITKGKNNWNDCDVMIQICWNRYREDIYFAEYLAANAQIKEKIKEHYGEIKYRQTELLFGTEFGHFSLPDLEQYRLLKLAVDLEQEVYRTKIRNFGDSISKVDVYLFKASDALREILKQRFKGCKITNLYHIREFQEFTKLNREGNEHAKRLIEWIDTDFVTNGNPLTGQKKMACTDIKKRLDITNRQWRYLLEEDDDFKEMLKYRRITQRKDKNGRNYLAKY